jgi:hypothetical protein
MWILVRIVPPLLVGLFEAVSVFKWGIYSEASWEEKNLLLWPSIQHLYRYIDDVLSINNDQFHSHVDSVYPSKLEIKDTTESSTSASYLDVLLNIDVGVNNSYENINRPSKKGGTIRIASWMMYCDMYHIVKLCTIASLRHEQFSAILWLLPLLVMGLLI